MFKKLSTLNNIQFGKKIVTAIPLSLVLLLVFVIGASAQNPTIVFFDSFTDGDLDNNPTWTYTTPAWNIVDGQLHHDGLITDGSGRYRTIFNSYFSQQIQAPDYIEMSYLGLLKSVGNPQVGQGMQLHLLGQGKAYQLRLHNGRTSGANVNFYSFALSYDTANGWVDLLTSDFAPEYDREYVIKAVRENGIWTLYVDSQEIGSAVDPLGMTQLERYFFDVTGSVIIDDVMLKVQEPLPSCELTSELVFCDNFADGDIDNNPTWTYTNPAFNVINGQLHHDGMVTDGSNRYRTIFNSNFTSQVNAPDYLEMSFYGLLKSVGNPQEGRNIQLTLQGPNGIYHLRPSKSQTSGSNVNWHSIAFSYANSNGVFDLIVSNFEPEYDQGYEIKAIRQNGIWTLYVDEQVIGSAVDPLGLTKFDRYFFDVTGSAIIDDVRLKVVEPLPPVEITGANMNIYNIVDGTGDGSDPNTFYGFETFINAEGEFATFDASKATLTVDGNPLDITRTEVSFDSMQYHLNVGGSFGGIPPLGEYAITIVDDNGVQSEPFVIGTLEDYPKDAPHFLYPNHENIIIETQPTITWQPFTSDYLGQNVAPWGYEINLDTGNSEKFTAFPIAGDQASQSFIDSNWDPYQPSTLSPGTYYLTIHSNHSVAPNFHFEHHRVIRFFVNQPPVADIGNYPEVYEGENIILDGSASYDPEEGDLTYEWDLDNDGEYDDAVGITIETTFYDNGIYLVGLKVTDEFGEFDIDTAEVSVLNVAPSVGKVTAPMEPIQVNTEINVNAPFSDPGADIWTASWDWGDGTSSAGTISEFVAAGSHTYEEPGVYTISLTVEDDDGGVGTASYQYVVAYDPEGGFVTGGGWIWSPEGAYTPDPTLTGKATFGFVSKYKKGATVPTGNTEFQFRVADLNFKSTAYDWLVIAGTKAMYKGTGTINGMGEYGFMLSAIDGSPDKFRIRIWDKATEELIYDNQLGAVEDADLVTELGGGSIVVHKTKQK